ncbi:MAG: AmmeMemoRadiSam system protein A, partial [Bacteroidales bacterium]
DLISRSDAFLDYPEAHASEHSIEVQLPFLQTLLKNPFKIVPIILGTQSPSVCKEIAEALKPYFTVDNLFIVSADFSHYPSYSDAIRVDGLTAESFCLNSPAEFLRTLKDNEKLRIPELATSMCAWPSGLTLLYLTSENRTLIFNKIDYKNSGDIKPYGDKNSVVGYHAISVSEPKIPQFELFESDKTELIRIARSTLESYVTNRTIPPLNSAGYGDNLMVRAGAFVTLKISGSLRGCIGSFDPDDPLYKVVQQMAIASCSRDSRFSPVRDDELGSIRIEISVLTPMRKIQNISEIKLGTHGIYIKKGIYGGTFLPQVATETGWSVEDFLGHCARDKAGIGWTGWKDADLYIYEAIIFDE